MPAENIDQARFDLLAQTIVANPHFAAMMQRNCAAMLAMYADFHPVVRLIGNHDRWLLAGIIYRCWVQSLAPGAQRPFSVSQIVAETVQSKIFSRNTVQSAMAEFIHYGFFTRSPSIRDRRVQALEVTPMIHAGIRQWFVDHLSTLDLMDDGRRAGFIDSNPDAVLSLHVATVDNFVSCRNWKVPPDDVRLFHKTKSGYLISEFLISTADLNQKADYHFPGLTASMLMDRFSISRSVLFRMLQQTQKAGILRTSGNGFTLSRHYVSEFMLWHAYKFASVELAWRSLMGKEDGNQATTFLADRIAIGLRPA